MRKLFMTDLNTKVTLQSVLNASIDGTGRKEGKKERKKERKKGKLKWDSQSNCREVSLLCYNQ
jgi:hypothetical protein